MSQKGDLEQRLVHLHNMLRMRNPRDHMGGDPEDFMAMAIDVLADPRACTGHYHDMSVLAKSVPESAPLSAEGAEVVGAIEDEGVCGLNSERIVILFEDLRVFRAAMPELHPEVDWNAVDAEIREDIETAASPRELPAGARRRREWRVPEAAAAGMASGSLSDDAGRDVETVHHELKAEVEWAAEPLTDDPLFLQVEIEAGEGGWIHVTGIKPDLGVPLELAAVALQPGAEEPPEPGDADWFRGRVDLEWPSGARQLVVWVRSGGRPVAQLKADLPD